MRTYSPDATRQARTQLRALVDAVDARAYRAAMTNLGRELGAVLDARLEGAGHVIVACTVEDADFLAAGVMEVLSARRPRRRLSFACFWNERTSLGRDPRFRIEQAPILRQYVEPHPKSVRSVVMLKSIISTACVVRTNLLQLLDEVKPETVIVAAPVMHADAEANLEREFPRHISERFSYVYFAKDTDRAPDGNLVPGIGGTVYERLGLGDKSTKNRVAPVLVVRRRADLEEALRR